MRRLALALAALAALVAACGQEERRDENRPQARAPQGDAAPRAPAPALCPDGVAGCRSASGRVLYVERVDPDGDGDAHFVLASRASITGPGISVIDVRRDLRPSPLPETGDRISAAGPVYRGSYGQKQIEAVVVHARR